MRSILAVVDPQSVPEQPAIQRAAWLASRTGSRVELFLCEHDPFVGSDEAAVNSLLESDRILAETAMEALSGDGLNVDFDVRWDRPLDEAIVRKVIESDPWMVVKGTEHHTVLRRTLLSNIDWNLIRQCPAPLLLAKDRKLSEPVRVLAALDPLKTRERSDDLDAEIIDLSRTLCDAAGGELHAAHVLQPIPAVAIAAVGGEPGTAATEAATERDEAARAEFDRLLRRASIDQRHGHLRRGPATELAVCADEIDADFVVMGAVSRGRLKEAIIGHTAEQVLDRLPCDLIVVKPRDFETRVSAA
jgi:universal stress protein E